MAAILQTTFSNAFSWMKNVWISNKNSLKFVPKGPIDNEPLSEAAMIDQLVYWRIYASLGLNGLK